MKNLYLLLALGLSLLCPALLAAQSVEIKAVDPSGYPTVNVHFNAYKSSGTKLKTTDFTGSDVWVRENGKDKFGTVDCPNQNLTKFSTILVIDITGSMNDKTEDNKVKMELAKLAAKTWIQNLPTPRFECAITCFHTWSYLLCDFTGDKSLLSKALLSDTLQAVAQNTDFNSALLYDIRNPAEPGALRIAERAKFTPYIIFLTDGGHNNNTRPFVLRQEIREKALELGAKIYTVTMTPRSVLAPSQAEDIEAISDKVYWNKNTEVAIKAAYLEILEEVKFTADPAPCIFTYESECDGGGEIVLNVNNSLVVGTDTTNFTIPSQLKPYIEYSADFQEPFLNVPPGTKQSRNFTLTPKQNFVKFTGEPVIDNPNFAITSPAPNVWNGMIAAKDNPLVVTVEYTAPVGDSICRQTNIDFVGTACGNRIGKVSAGWLLTRPIDFGARKINSEHTLDYTAVFCNNSCYNINIDDMYIAGGHANKFAINSQKYTGSLAAGQCVNLTFSFTPDKAEDYASLFNVIVDGKLYSSTIKGTGSGNAEINTVSAFTYSSNASCDVPVILDTVAVESTGALDLVISDITITPVGGPFKIMKPVIPPNYVIPNGEKGEVIIEFNPTEAKTHTGYTLNITSNSITKPVNSIPLIATMDSIGYATDIATVDIGIICPGETGQKTITLSPLGSTVNFDVNAVAGGSLSSSDIGGGVNQWPLTPGNSQQVNIAVSGNKTGVFNGTIQFTDSKCKKVITVPVTWEIALPDVEDQVIAFVANVPQTDKKTVTITNNSKRDYSITDTIFRNSDFYIENGTLNLPQTLAKNGGTLSFDIVYAPTASGSITSYLVFEGSPCTYSDSITVTGAATAAKTDIAIDEHTGIVGEVINVPINLLNANNFKNSNTVALSTTVQYDNTLLQPQQLNLMNGNASVIGSDVLQINNIPVQSTDSPQPGIDNIKFLVLPNSPQTSCPLVIKNTLSDGSGQAFYTEVNGKFTLDAVSANIEVGSVTAYVGESIKIPVTVTNFVNYKPAVNKTLNVDIKFNKSILECTDPSVTSVVSGDDRIATVSIPLAGLSGATLPTVQKSFRTMLGTAESTPLEIVNVSFENGQLSTVNSDGTLSLRICKAGGDRLYDPNTPVAAVFAPQPTTAGSSSEVKYQTPEKGLTKVLVSDILGNCVMVLVNSEHNPGAYSIPFDCSDLPNGVYIITIQTETQMVSQMFSIVN